VEGSKSLVLKPITVLGAVFFLFEGPRSKWILKETEKNGNGKEMEVKGKGRDYRYLHCGDFRAVRIISF